MRIKNGILLLLICMGTSAFAGDAIIFQNMTSDKSAITSSNYKSQNVQLGNLDAEMMGRAIKDLKNQIKNNPDNYVLYANLADVYVKSRQFDKSLDNLIYLYNLNKNGMLGNDTINVLNKMHASYKRIGQKEGDLCLNLAVISLIINDTHAVDYAIAGADRAGDIELSKKTLGILFESNQDAIKVISACDKVLSRKPDDVEVRKIKANYHVQANQTREAIGEYAKILELNPNDDDSRYYLYQLLSQFKNIDDKEMIKRLYGMFPSFSYEQAYVSMTELMLKHSNFNSAKSYATTLIKKYDENPNSYILMAEINKREGKIKEAYETLSKARDKADDNETIAKYNVMLAKLSDEPVKEANSLIANGLYDQALEVLDSANPENLYVILTQARTNYLLGNKQKTFDLLNKAMSLFQENSDVYCAFGYIYLQEKDNETARKYANRSLKIDKNNQTAQALLDLINKADSGQYTLGILDAIEAQNYSEAMRLVNEAMEIDNKSADLYYYKSLIYIALNNYSASTSTLYKCIEINRKYTPAYFYLGLAFDNLGETENALTFYKNYIDMADGEEISESERIDYAKARINRLQN